MLNKRFCYSTLVLLEKNAEKFPLSNNQLITAARLFKEPIHGFIVTKGDTKPIEGLIDKLYITKHIATVEGTSNTLLEIMKQEKYNRILGAHSSLARSVLPRVAASLDSACLSDVIAIDSDGTVIKRPIYAGKHYFKPRKCDN